MNAASTFRQGLNAGRGCGGCERARPRGRRLSRRPVRPPDSAAWSTTGARAEPENALSGTCALADWTMAPIAWSGNARSVTPVTAAW
jgi:hypothetical protein